MERPLGFDGPSRPYLASATIAGQDRQTTHHQGLELAGSRPASMVFLVELKTTALELKPQALYAPVQQAAPCPR